MYSIPLDLQAKQVAAASNSPQTRNPPNSSLYLVELQGSIATLSGDCISEGDSRTVVAAGDYLGSLHYFDYENDNSNRQNTIIDSKKATTATSICKNAAILGIDIGSSVLAGTEVVLRRPLAVLRRRVSGNTVCWEVQTVITQKLAFTTHKPQLAVATETR